MPLIFLARPCCRCGDGSCEHEKNIAFTLLNWNWNGDTGNPRSECEFTFGSRSGRVLSSSSDSVARRSSGLTATCKNCYAYAQVTLNMVMKIQNWEMHEFGIWAEGNLGYNFDFSMIGNALNWDYERSMGSFTPSGPMLSFRVFGVPFSLRMQVPMSLGVTAGTQQMLHMDFSSSATVRLTAGIRYSKARKLAKPSSKGWELVNKASLSLPEANFPRLDTGGAEVAVKLSFLATFKFNLCFGGSIGSIGGPVVPLSPYLEITAGLQLGSPQTSPPTPPPPGSCDSSSVRVDVHAGLDGGIGAEVQLNLLDMLTFPSPDPFKIGPFGILAYKRPLMSGCYSLGVDCTDSPSWSDNWGVGCNWYAQYDPGCNIYEDYGQQSSCRATCGTCTSGRRLQSAVQLSQTREAGVGDVFEGEVVLGAPCGFPRYLFVSMQMIDYRHCMQIGFAFCNRQGGTSAGGWSDYWLEEYTVIVTVSGGNDDIESGDGFAAITQGMFKFRRLADQSTSPFQKVYSSEVDYDEATASDDLLPSLHAMLGGPDDSGDTCSDGGSYIWAGRNPITAGSVNRCSFRLCKVITPASVTTEDGRRCKDNPDWYGELRESFCPVTGCSTYRVRCADGSNACRLSSGRAYCPATCGTCGSRRLSEAPATDHNASANDSRQRRLLPPVARSSPVTSGYVDECAMLHGGGGGPSYTNDDDDDYGGGGGGGGSGGGGGGGGSGDGDDGGGGGFCFARSTAHACRLLGPAVPPSAAFQDCFGLRMPVGVAEKVLMSDLTAGDLVLSNVDEVSRVILNLHKDSNHSSEMVRIEYVGGWLELTPDHLLLVDGRVAAASEVRDGSLLEGPTSAIPVVSVLRSSDGIINPITTSGFILTSGSEGVPVIASHGTAGIGQVLLSSAGLLLTKYSLISRLARFFPDAIQAYYDEQLEGLFFQSKQALDGIANYPPLPVSLAICLAADVGLAASFVSWLLNFDLPAASFAAMTVSMTQWSKGMATSLQ